MRKIAPREVCLTSAEISRRFLAATGVDLHPTNVGNAAKSLGLDFLEVDDPEALDPAWGVRRKLYSLQDVPQIFLLLEELAQRRARYGPGPGCEPLEHSNRSEPVDPTRLVMNYAADLAREYRARFFIADL